MSGAQGLFLQRARARMHDANLLVVNHHLLFSDLALRQSGASFLPDVGALVLDEAHTVEDTASEHLGIRLSVYAFEHWLRRLYVPEPGKGLLKVLKAESAMQTATQIWNATATFFRSCRGRLAWVRRTCKGWLTRRHR